MSHIAAVFIRNHKKPETNFLISEGTFLVRAQASFPCGATANVFHVYSLWSEDVRSVFGLSRGQLEAWVTRAGWPWLLLQCCHLPRRPRSKPEVTLKGVDRGLLL